MSRQVVTYVGIKPNRHDYRRQNEVFSWCRIFSDIAVEKTPLEAANYPHEKLEHVETTEKDRLPSAHGRFPTRNLTTAPAKLLWLISKRKSMLSPLRHLNDVVTSLSTRGVRGSIPGPIKSDTISPMTRHRRNVSLELCCPDAKPRRWTPPLVTRFDVIPRV